MPLQRLTEAERLEKCFIDEVKERRQARREYRDTLDPELRAELLEEIDGHTAEIESILLEHLGNIAVKDSGIKALPEL